MYYIGKSNITDTSNWIIGECTSEKKLYMIKKRKNKKVG